MTKLFLTAKDVADILKLNILTVYEYIRTNKLKAVKFGRTYRIEDKDLNKFVESNKTF